jgi:putative hemolysin
MLRTALLVRELFNKARFTVEIRAGHAIAPEKLARMTSDQERIDYLRWRCYLLSTRNPFSANTKTPLRRAPSNGQAPVIAPVPSEVLAREIGALPPNCLLDRSGDLQVLLAQALQIPATLREIGRLREITFRQAGEGAGRDLDLDRFDSHYLHLFLWNSPKREIVGAYRLSPAHRAEDLYTQTLFQFDQRFLHAIGPALELGRSFIRAEYQIGFAPLLLLWKGIGKFIAAHPGYKTLFGPVSISNQYQAASRELMIAFLDKHASLAQWIDLVRARNEPAPPRVEPPCRDIEELSEIIGDLEPSRPGIPVLLRQYLKLGGKLLGFNVDPEFSNVLDGLIVVDLTKTEPKLLERYLGKAEAASFFNFHKESFHGTQ